MSMTCRFLMPNEEYSSEFAEKHNEGKESADNYKILWEDEFSINGKVVSVELSKEDTFFLQGQKDGEDFQLPIANMKIWEVNGDNQNRIAVSESVIETVDFDLEKEVFELVFKEKSVLTNVIPGVYIDVDDFPKELVQ